MVLSQPRLYTACVTSRKKHVTKKLAVPVVQKLSFLPVADFRAAIFSCSFVSTGFCRTRVSSRSLSSVGLRARCGTFVGRDPKDSLPSEPPPHSKASTVGVFSWIPGNPRRIHWSPRRPPDRVSRRAKAHRGQVFSGPEDGQTRTHNTRTETSPVRCPVR